jgi:transcriptional regulator with XRE-family HTH domain
MVKITESKITFGKGLTNRQIAALLGVTRQTIWNWKTGKSRPTPALLRKIKKVF